VLALGAWSDVVVAIIKPRTSLILCMAMLHAVLTRTYPDSTRKRITVIRKCTW
jgi:hypothetical protein